MERSLRDDMRNGFEVERDMKRSIMRKRLEKASNDGGMAWGIVEVQSKSEKSEGDKIREKRERRVKKF